MPQNTRPDFTFVIPNTRWHREGEGRYWNHIWGDAFLDAAVRHSNLVRMGGLQVKPSRWSQS